MLPFPMPVYQDHSVTDGAGIEITQERHYFAVLNRCLATYDVVVKQFRPFSDQARDEFPHGRHGTLRQTKDHGKRIEVSYPSHFVPGNHQESKAFVEPRSVATGYPLVHLRSREHDGRLFGENGQKPTLIPHEYAHALHFGEFSSVRRAQIQNDYLGWIVQDIVNGGDGAHLFGKQTNPKVAYIEAFGYFSARFAEYIRVATQGGSNNFVGPQPMTADIRRAFLADEMSEQPKSKNDPIVSGRSGTALIPKYTGGSDEAAVYGCIYVDFARRVGLRTAVNAVLLSAAQGACTFGQYQNWIEENRPDHAAQLAAAQQTWGL
jgi:hypothetical protein